MPLRSAKKSNTNVSRSIVARSDRGCSHLHLEIHLIITLVHRITAGNDFAQQASHGRNGVVRNPSMAAMSARGIVIPFWGFDAFQ